MLPPPATLCHQCGLCCNGVLFSNLKLQPSDNLESLAQLGLHPLKRGQSFRIPQPCPALQGTLCTIYSERPSYCRQFECRLLQKVNARQLSLAQAERVVAEAKRRAQTVRDWVRELGQTDETLPLNVRYRRIMKEPLDLTKGRQTDKLRGQFMQAVDELMQYVQKEFLS